MIRAVHEEQLAEHGGGSGLRDAGLLESALARPRQLAAYCRPDLAASYGYGIDRNHPGNNRTAFVALELFLMLNGADLTVDDANFILTMLSIVADDIDEAAFANWIRSHLQNRK